MDGSRNDIDVSVFPNTLIDLICQGYVMDAYLLLRQYDDIIHMSADLLHIQSGLDLILYARVDKAVELHKNAKLLNSTLIPPLASLFLQGRQCIGLHDLFYVSAVIIKQLVDSNSSLAVVLSGHTSLITLTADSGLHDSSENHLTQCRRLDSDDSACVFRAILSTPAIFSSIQSLHFTRAILTSRVVHAIENMPHLLLKDINEFSLSSTFYLVYQGYNDRPFLEKLNRLYTRAFPSIAAILPHVQTQITNTNNRLIRIGFVSSYIRQHSICKLFCGIITGLSRNKFDVYVYSSTPRGIEDDMTRDVENHSTFIRIGKPLVHNRHLVSDRNIDIVIYLDIGMDASMKLWASSRLAPIQVSTIL
jgi:hypothetical protein